MIYKDRRLAGAYDISVSLFAKKMNDLFLGHSFDGMEAVKVWITTQVESKVLHHKSFPGNFDLRKLPAGLKKILASGDLLYAELFETNVLLPNDRPTIVNPLTDVLRQIYYDVWDKQNPVESDFSVYRDLQNHISGQMGILLAAKTIFNSVSKWWALIHCFSGSHQFYHALVDNIPVNTIEEHQHELIPTHDPNNVLKDAGYPLSHHNSEDFNRQYLSTITELVNATPWKYVSTLSRHSSAMMLDDLLSFKKQLVLRLPPRYWVDWFQALHWPVLQASAIHILEDAETMLVLIQAIVDKSKTPDTKTIHFLLIALHHFAELLRRISVSLDALPANMGNLFGLDEQQKQDEFDKATAERDRWRTQSLTEIGNQLWDIIFAEQPVSSSPYVTAVVEWLPSQSRETWLQNPTRDACLLTIDTLHETFAERLINDTVNKSLLAQILTAGGYNWFNLRMLFKIYSHDETDDMFREEVLNHYISYTQNEHFKWNTAFDSNDDILNQAYEAGYLLNKEADADNHLFDLLESLRVWHEGWNYNSGIDIEGQRKLLYWLLAGSGTVYSRYNNGNVTSARQLLYRLTGWLMAQYRSAHLNSDAERYGIPLRFLLQSVAQFDPLELNRWLDIITAQVDTIELLLLLATDLAELTSKHVLSIDPSLLDRFSAAIEAEAWTIDLHNTWGKMNPKFNQEKNQLARFRAFFAAQKSMP